MGISENATKIMTQIANLDLVGVSHSQIAESMGIDPSRVTQIVETKTYKDIKENLGTEIISKQQNINSGWDDLEEKAITNLNTVMKYNKDPDFNLRVAAVANKANRRNPNGAAPINQLPGARATISLPTQFVQLIQVNNGVLRTKAPERTTLPTQRFDILTPGQVEKTFATLGSGVLEGLDVSGFENNGGNHEDGASGGS